MYVSKQFTEDIVLPDGSLASCAGDIDKFCHRAGVALAADYSPDTIRKIRHTQEKARRSENFAAFIHNYKRIIWK